MKTSNSILFCLWIASATIAYTQEPNASMRHGEDDDATITPKVAETIRELVAKAPLSTPTPVWLMFRHASLIVESPGEHVCIEVLLRPWVSTTKLIRGECIICNNLPVVNRSFEDSPLLDGWTLTNPKPLQYAFVSSDSRGFDSAHLPSQHFTVQPEVTDADVIALVDTVRQFVHSYRISAVRYLNSENLANVICESLDQKTIGSQKAPLEVTLERDGGNWIVVDSEEQAVLPVN